MARKQTAASGTPKTSLRVPFSYSMLGKEGFGKRLILPAAAKVLVEIRHLDPSEAPVVARAEYVGQFCEEEWGKEWGEPIETDIDYRMVGGRLMARALPDRRFLGAGERTVPASMLGKKMGQALSAWRNEPGRIGPETAQAAMDVLAEQCRNGVSLFTHMLPGRSPDLSDDWGDDEDGDLECFSEHSNDKALMRNLTLRDMAEASAFVGGALYVPSMGPYWYLDFNTDQIGVVGSELGTISDGCLQWAFTPEDMETARSIASEDNEEFREFPDFNGFIQVSPDFPVRDPDGLLLLYAASRLDLRRAHTALSVMGSQRGLEALREVADAQFATPPGAERLRTALAELSGILPEASPMSWAEVSDPMDSVVRRELYRKNAKAGLFPVWDENTDKVSFLPLPKPPDDQVSV